MSPPPLLLQADAVVLPDRVLVGGAVRCREGRIHELGTELAPAAEERLEGAWLLPGFIDLHWHGHGGHGLSEAAEARAAVQAVAAAGVTTCYAGLGAGDGFTALLDSVAAAAAVVDTRTGGARLAGVFLEGPYISVQKRGAWIVENLRLPSVPELESLAQAAQGRLARVNVAPELSGALEFIQAARRLGIAVSLGHSNATYEQALLGIEAGATIANHTYNAMSALEHRAPGLVGAVLSGNALLAELILDGEHVHPAAARLLFAARGSRGVALITDGLQLAGMPPGRYDRGGRTLTVEGSACRLPDGTLAGSVSTFDRDLRNARAWLTADPLALAALSSGNAAAAMGLTGETGSIRTGLRADLVLLDEGWNVLATVVGGEVVYCRGVISSQPKENA